MALWWLLHAGVARVGLVGVPFACGAGPTFGGFGAFGASWRLLGLLGYLLPAKLGVLHAGVCGAGRTFGGFGAFGKRPARHFKRFKGLKAGKRQA